MFKSRPRVLFVSYTADWTGPSNSLLLLLKYLRDDYDVAVLLPGQGSFSEALSCAAIPVFSFPSLNKWSIPSIYRLIRRESFDLVYGNSTHGSSRNALIAAKLARVPFICHVREMGWGKSWKEIGFLRFPNSVVGIFGGTFRCPYGYLWIEGCLEGVVDPSEALYLHPPSARLCEGMITETTAWSIVM